MFHLTHSRIYLMFVFICIYPFFFSETGEAFIEEYPNNKRDQKTLEDLILKRVQLGTKILEVELLRTFSRAKLCCFCML